MLPTSKRSAGEDAAGPEKKSKASKSDPVAVTASEDASAVTEEVVAEGPVDSGAAKEAAPSGEAEAAQAEPEGVVSRLADEDLVRDVVIGYTGDEDEDPPQAGASRETNSQDITQMVSSGLDIPISKDQRSNYVWVAAAKVTESAGNQEVRRKKYTWNPEEIQPLDSAMVESKQIRCDICGAKIKEVLYEFRCYRRRRPDEPRSVRRLHRFVSYISKECGRGLLGLPSGASTLRERIYRLLMNSEGASALEELEEVWRYGNATMRQILVDELRFLSRTEAGVPRRAAELKKAEAVHGELNKEKEDVFRAVARVTGPSLNARDLAAVTIRHAEEQDENVTQPSGRGKDGVQETQSFLGQVAAGLQERKPLPAVPAPWSRAEVVTCIQALVNAWQPLRIELHDSLHEKQVFQGEQLDHQKKKRKKEKVKEMQGPLISLVYLPGCQELHSLTAQSCSRESIQALKEKREDFLKQCKEEYGPLEGAHTQGRYSRAEDRSIEIPEESVQITFEHVSKALNQITWPNCFTRNNVRPDGAPFIEAFPLGVVLNYALGLVCSRPTRLWPNLTKLLARFIAQEQPDFRYTTVQLNKNYATKMHVDGNNHGPSYIIGLGDYTGGEVWILDEENGTVEVELLCTLRGWPHLRPGTKVKGRLEDCRNKWLKFDGNRPHMTMPYKGSRISLVFFTRKGWLTMLPETKESLESSGFLLPGEDFLKLSTAKDAKDEEVKEKKVAKAPPVKEAEETESDDEVDEDEKVDEIMRAEQDADTWPSWNWASKLRDHLGDFTGTNFGNSKVNVALLGSANVFGIALQELLSQSALRIVTCTETGGVAMRLMKRTLKPQHAFLNLGAAMTGNGHCDIHHKVCTSDTRSEGTAISEDLLFGSFPCEPFLNQDPEKPSCFDDPRSEVFRSLKKHLVVQQPTAALLMAEGWQKLPEVSRSAVQSFLLDGKDPRVESYEAFWGLSHLKGYGAAFVEVALGACGVPLAGHEAMIVLIRDDYGGASAAEAASQLVKEMLNAIKLQPCSLHSLMFNDEDPRVVQAQREAKEASQKTRARRKAQNAAMRRKMNSEVRDLGLQPGEAPYTEFLKTRSASARLGQQSQAFADKWIKQTPDEKAVLVNLLFARARQDGLDLQNLCADLSQGLVASGRSDDGLLPRPSVQKVEDSVSEFYSFSQHRTLVGQELLLCLGYPIWRLDFRGISDAEATSLACRSAAVPAVGVCVAATLAVVGLPGAERISKKCMDHLLSKVETKEEKPEEAKEIQVPAEKVTQKLSVVPDEDGARLESKAAALLNLVSHGTFASDVKPASKREAASSIISALSIVAKDAEGEDQEKNGTKRKDPEPDEAMAMGVLPMEEPLDWQVRLRKLTFASAALVPLSLDMVLKWVKEAVEDRDADLSRDVIQRGVQELQRRIFAGEEVPEAMFRSRHEVINKLKESSLAELAEELDLTMRSSQLAKSFARGARHCLDGQTKESMEHYVKTVVGGCDRKGWIMRRVFIHHLSQVSAKVLQAGDQSADKADQSLAEFGTANGWTYITSWLKETVDPSTWPPAEVLDQLGSSLPTRCPAPLFAALYAVLTSPKLAYSAKSLGRLERLLAKSVSLAFDLRTVEHAMPQIQEIASNKGALSARFQLVVKLMSFALELLDSLKSASTSQTWQQHQQKIQELRAAVSASASKRWQQLSALEMDFVEDLKQKVEENLKLSLEKEEAVRKKEEEAQLSKAQENLEQCRLAVLAMAEDGFKQKTQTAVTSGLKRCLSKMKNLHDAMQKTNPSPLTTEAWNTGRAAVQHFSAVRVQCSKAFQWLQKKQLGFCAQRLDNCGLLERLHVIRESPQKLATVGLPYRCCQLLLAAAEEDALSKETFGPKLEEVPSGWERNTSRHFNLQYFQKQGGKIQWEWPLPSNLVPWRNDGGVNSSTSEIWQQKDEEHVLPEAKPMVSSSKSEADERPHIEGPDLKHWKQLTDRMAMVCLDLLKLPEDESRRIGLASAWRGELWLALRAHPAPPKNVLASFWKHIVLRKLFPTASSPEHDRETNAGLQSLFKDALKVARSCGSEEMKPLEEQIFAATASVKRKMSGLTTISITSAVAALKELRLAMIASSAFVSSRPSVLDQGWTTLLQAEAAVQQFCSESALHPVVQSWLQERRLGSCFPVLVKRGVLAAIAKGEAVQADAAHGLPTHVSEKLSEAWHPEGPLRRLAPKRSAPNDWEMVFSRSVGLFYYCHKGTGKTQWPYPVPPEYDTLEGSLPEVPSVFKDWARGEPVRGRVPYVEMDSAGEPLSLLSNFRGLEHFASSGHAENVALWSSVRRRLSDLERELNVQATLLTSTTSAMSSIELAALGKVWCQEIHRNVVELDKSERKLQVNRAFWHLLIGRWASRSKDLVQVQQELDRALTIAALSEPEWSALEWQPRLPPEPGMDFPWPATSTEKLPPSAPEGFYETLDADALKGEGITTQANGSLWCNYCEKSVARKQLSSHLDRRNLEAREHLQNKSAEEAVVAKLKDEGYQLRWEGLTVSKRRFYCSLCCISGHWKWICDHRSTPTHREKYESFVNSSCPAAVQALMNNKNFEEAEKEFWNASYQAMEA